VVVDGNSRRRFGEQFNLLFATSACERIYSWGESRALRHYLRIRQETSESRSFKFGSWTRAMLRGSFTLGCDGSRRLAAKATACASSGSSLKTAGSN